MTNRRDFLTASAGAGSVLAVSTAGQAQTGSDGPIPPQYLLSFVLGANMNLYNKLVTSRPDGTDFAMAEAGFQVLSGWLNEAGLEDLMTKWLTTVWITARTIPFAPASVAMVNWMRMMPQQAFPVSKPPVSIRCNMTDPQANAYVLSTSRYFPAFQDTFIRLGVAGLNTAVQVALNDAADGQRRTAASMQNLGVAQQWIAVMNDFQLGNYWNFYLTPVRHHYPSGPPLPSIGAGGVDFPVAIYPLEFIFARLRM